MGWFSKIVSREDDLIGTIFELETPMKAIGFSVARDNVMTEAAILNRLKCKRGGFSISAAWDGEVLTFLQRHDLGKGLEIFKYQEFHKKNHYFTLTFGGPGNILIVKHATFMSVDNQIPAGNIQRLINVWEEHLDCTAPGC